MRLRILCLLFALVVAQSAVALPWSASGAESLNVTILGSYPVRSATGIWCCAAFVTPDGHEYGILGADSLHVVDLANPRLPRKAAVIPPALPPQMNPYYVHVSVWGQYAYAAGRNGPIKIIDLHNPALAHVVGEIPRNEFCACSCGHPCDDPNGGVIETLFIDERGILYVTGIECGTGMLMYDLSADPIHPRWLCHEHTIPGPGWEGYVHDVNVLDGILYVSRSRGSFPDHPPRWDILDGDPLCPVNPGECGDGVRPGFISTFHHSGIELHSHSAWRLTSSPVLLTTDEKINGHVRIWDVSNLTQPSQIAEIRPDGTCHSVHNIYGTGSLAYAAWYNKGIQVFDMTNPNSPERVGYYEHPGRWHALPGDHCCDPTDGQGATCYGIPYIDPFFPSGIFVASEVGSGLLIGHFNRTLAACSRPPARDSGGKLTITTQTGSRSLRAMWIGGRERPPCDLQVFTVGGTSVATLPPSRSNGGGSYEYRWQGTDYAGRTVASGLYFIRVACAPTATGRAVLLD
jgi:hypothetical protein